MELKEVNLPDVEFTIQDGIFIKQMYLKDAGMFVPQHSHKYEHASMLAYGSIRVWQDGELKGDFKAPVPINIPAGCKHTFMSLEPETVVYCIHNCERFGGVEIEDHHEFVDENIIEEGVKCLSA